MTGYPWQTGDLLLANDLNAAFAALGGTGFLPLTGGTLIGALALWADPSTAMQAATKNYVDVGFVPNGGGTMTGYLTLSGDPASGLHAATKHYVDQQTAVGTPPGGPFLPLAGGTVTGPTTIGSTLNVTGALTGSSTGTFSGTLATTGTNFIQAGNLPGTNNIIRVTPAVSGSTPAINMSGPDTDIGLRLGTIGAGVVTIPRMNGGATVVLSGTSTGPQSPFFTQSAFSGSTTDARSYHQIVAGTDNVAAASGKPNTCFSVVHYYGGPAMAGGRIALNAGLLQTAATQNTSGVFTQAVNFSNTATAAEPFQSTPSNTGSAVYTIGAYATLTPTATGYGILAGYEQDICAGAQPWSVLGISVVRLSGGFGTLYQAAEPSVDTAFRIGSAITSANWINGYTVTSPTAPWAMDTVQGTLFKAFPGQNYGAVKPAAAVGIDLSYVAFNTAAWHSQGAIIDGSGNASFNRLAIGNWSAALSSTGLTLDTVSNQVVLSATVASGGTLYHVNEQFSFATGGRGIVTAAGGGGVVAAFTILEYPTSTSPPANPVATASLMFAGAGQGVGSGLTLTLTWSPAATLSLNPTGHQILTNMSAAATDAAAATAGVPIGGLYNNAGVVHVRLT